MGDDVYVTVTAANAAGGASETSSIPTRAVVPAPPQATTAGPTITGIAGDGQTLTASSGTFLG